MSEGTIQETAEPSVSKAETEYYRVQKLLPSGEWYGWSTKLTGFDSALGHLEALQETGETFRLVRCVVSVEVVEDEGICEMCSSYEHNHPNMWCREAVIVPRRAADLETQNPGILTSQDLEATQPDSNPTMGNLALRASRRDAR